MITVYFQGKLLNITVIQVHCTPASNTEDAEVEWFYKDLQDLLELTDIRHDTIKLLERTQAKHFQTQIIAIFS